MAIDLDHFDLGSLEFWDHPAEERDGACALLGGDALVSHDQPPDTLLEVEQVDERGYWAVVRYEDIRHVSRNPDVFCSGQGTQFGDAPPEMLEASQSFLAMDAPRHTKLRGLVSSAFTPRQGKRIEDGIRQRAKEIVERAAPTGGGDFVDLYVKELPLQTVS